MSKVGSIPGCLSGIVDWCGTKRPASPPISPPGPSQARYDVKDSFRIQQIPVGFDSISLARELASATKLDIDFVHIHSLSKSPQDANSTPYNTATVSFDKPPSFYQGRGLLLDSTTKAISKSCSLRLRYREREINHVIPVLVDQHFLGLTPLSPVDHQERSIIEWVHFEQIPSIGLH
jgi:hypothetical protein